MKTAEWWLFPKLKEKSDNCILYDDFDEEKEKTGKKITFENDSDDAIPESVSKLNKIVSYDDTDSDRNLLFTLYSFLD